MIEAQLVSMRRWAERVNARLRYLEDWEAEQHAARLAELHDADDHERPEPEDEA